MYLNFNLISHQLRGGISLLFLFGLLLSLPLYAENSYGVTANEYYRLINYYDKEIQGEIPAFEKKLISLSNDILNRSTITKIETDENKKIGLALAYISMFIVNTNDGLEYNIISRKSYFLKFSFTGSLDYETEMVARASYANRLMKIARKFSPNDSRMEAWDASTLYKLERYKFKKPTKKTTKKLIRLAGEDPVFHLFNALVLSNEHTFTEEENKVLLSQADLMSSLRSPALPWMFIFNYSDWKRSQMTSRSPLGYQGVMTMMGDLFTKEASKLLNDSIGENDEEGYSYITKANRLYERVQNKGNTKEWLLSDDLEKRMEVLNNLRDNQVPVNNYFKTSDAQKLYSCVACHQNGTSENVFDL